MPSELVQQCVPFTGFGWLKFLYLAHVTFMKVTKIDADKDDDTLSDNTPLL
jgi:hypothetical protein